MTTWVIGIARIQLSTIVDNRNDCTRAQLLRTDTRVLNWRRFVQLQSKWKASTKKEKFDDE